MDPTFPRPEPAVDAEWKFVLKLTEGFGKLLVFLAAWLALPAVLPAGLARRVAVPVAFVAALFAVGLAALVAQRVLPPGWRFLDPPPPVYRATGPAGGVATADLLHPELTPDYEQWRRASVAGTLVLVPLGWGFAWAARRSVAAFYPPAAAAGEAVDGSSARVVAVAGLLAAGSVCDFVKWFLTPP